VLPGGLSQSDQDSCVVSCAADIIDRGEHTLTMNNPEFARWKMVAKKLLLTCRDQIAKRINVNMAQLRGKFLQVVISAEVALRQVNDERKGKQRDDGEH
jgi:hypothetical protein